MENKNILRRVAGIDNVYNIKRIGRCPIQNIAPPFWDEICHISLSGQILLPTRHI